MRTKAQVHCLTGHTNTVAEVRCQAAEPQVCDTLTLVQLHFRHFFENYLTSAYRHLQIYLQITCHDICNNQCFVII